MNDKKLHIALVESALETVPKEIIDHPAVVKNARRRGKKPWEVLLDVSLHYHAMKNLKDWFKRGRPDIVHVTLLEALESPLNRSGLLEIYIHTYGDYVLFIDPETRIPRNYNRFVGLIEQVFAFGKAPLDTDKPLLYIRNMDLKKLVHEIGLNGYVLLHEKGVETTFENVVKTCLEKRYLIGVGGFPHGDFRKDILEDAVMRVSVYHESLPSWIIVSRLIFEAEKLLGIIR
ncbi:MAG: 16S rRNA methyltransferase [Desulfurococcaceae archaeon]